jgi:GAF domain-containing protein
MKQKIEMPTNDSEPWLNQSGPIVESDTQRPDAKVITAVATHLINLAPDDIDNGINHILRLIGQHMEADRSIVVLLQHQRVRDSYEWCAPGITSNPQFFYDLLLEDYPWLLSQLKHQRYVHIPQVEQLPPEAHREKTVMQRQALRSFITIPLVTPHAHLGFLALLTHRRERTWNQDEIALLQIVAEVFINALQRKEIEQREILAYKIGAKLASLLSKEDLLHFVSEQLRESFGYYHTQIFLTNSLLAADQTTPVSHLIVQASTGVVGSRLKERGHTISLNSPRSIVARAARTYETIVVNDVHQISFHLPNPALPETRSEAAIPLINEETLIGVLDVQHVEPEHFNENEIRTLQIIAHQLSTALAKSALFARNQLLLTELRLLQAVALVANDASDEDELFEQITHIVAPALRADVFGFSLVNPINGYRSNHPSYIYRADRPVVPVCGPGEGICGQVVKTGKAWRVADVRQEPAFLGDSETRSELCVPIIIDQQVVAVINAESSQLDAFTPADERLLLTIAGQITTTLAKLRHFRNARQQAAETAALLATSKAISSLKLDYVLNTIATEARKLFQADTCRIHLLDSDNKMMHCVVAISEQTEQAILDFSLPVGVGITGHVAISGVPEIVVNTLHDPRGIQIPGTPEEDETVALAPLIIRQKVIGVMTITRQDVARPFTQTNLHLLTAFADQAAVAIDNARLFAAERRRLEELMTLNEAANISARATQERALLEEMTVLLQRVLAVDSLEVVLDGPKAMAEPTAVSPARTISAPIVIGTQVVGKLLATRKAPQRFEAPDEQLLQTFARQLATGLEKVRLIAAEKKRAWRQQKLAETASSLLGIRDMKELGPTITAVAQQALTADRVAIFIYQLDQPMVNCLYAHNLSSTYIEAVRERFWELPGVKLLQQRPAFTIDDATKDEIITPLHDLIREEGFHSYAAFALPGSQASLGILLIYRNHVAPFAPDDLTTGQTLAYSLSLAYQNVQLLQEIRHALDREQRLNEISRTLNTTPDLPTILSYILRTATDLISADAGLIGLVIDHQTITFYPYNIPTSINLRPSSRGGGVAWQIVESGQPVLENRYENHPRADKKLLQAGARSLIGVPITAGDECLGAIQLFSFTPGKQFSQRDLELCESIGRQAGIALQNGRLFTDLMERAQALAQALARQEELDEAKNQFVQNISHELRTPLGLIFGYAELLDSNDLGELNPAQKQAMAIIIKRTQMLTNLLDDMSVMLAAETQDFRREALDLAALIHSVHHEFTVQAEKADVELTANVADDLSPIEQMTEKMTRQERKAAYLKEAEQLFEKMETWYDQNPEATFEEIEDSKQ